MKKLLIILLAIAPVGVFAQAYQLNLQGTRQIGKGSTGLAQPTDATSLFTNPGSAVFSEGNDVTLGVSPAFTKGTFTDANTNVVNKSDNPIETPFNLSASFGKGDWKFGVSVYTPFGSTMKWEPGSAGMFEVERIALLTISVQPTVSYKITDKLGIGVGLVYTYGRVDIENKLPLQFNDGSFAGTKIESDANGFGVNAGLYYEVSDKVSLAATYRSSMNMESSGGTINFDVPDVLRGQFPNQGIDAMLPMPQIFGLGVSYKPTEEWVVNGEAYLSDWSKYDIIDIKFEEEQVNGEDATQLIRHYDKGYSFRVGGEYLPKGKKYELRAGLIYGVSPIHDEYVSPDVPDANRLNPVVGASYKFSDKFRADFAFLAEFVHREAHNKTSNIEGTYNFDLFFPSIGLTYKY